MVAKFTVQFLLKYCYELIAETIEEEVEFHSWNNSERKGMLKAIDEAIELIKKDGPQFKTLFKKKPCLKLVPTNQKD